MRRYRGGTGKTGHTCVPTRLHQGRASVKLDRSKGGSGATSSDLHNRVLDRFTDEERPRTESTRPGGSIRNKRTPRSRIRELLPELLRIRREHVYTNWRTSPTRKRRCCKIAARAPERAQRSFVGVVDTNRPEGGTRRTVCANRFSWPPTGNIRSTSGHRRRCGFSPFARRRLHIGDSPFAKSPPGVQGTGAGGNRLLSGRPPR